GGLVGRGAQLVGDARLAEQAGDAGERLEMVGAGALRREQQEDEIDRLVVEGLEIERLRQTREQAENARQAGQLAMRDGDAVADAGRAELLPLEQRLEDLALVETGHPGRLLGERLDDLLLAADLEGTDYGV